MATRIVRVPRRHRYSQIDTRCVEDTRLSWAARGLLAYLLSRPDDWKILVNHLVKQGDVGRDGIYRLLKELRTYSYVEFMRHRDKGRVTHCEYFVHEAPPDPDSPDPAEPDEAPPDPAKPDVLPNIDNQLRRTTTTTDDDGSRSQTKTEQDLVYPAGILPAERDTAEVLVGDLELGVRQLVLDEWTGIIVSGRIRATPIACLKGLISSAESGTFTPDRALRIRHDREARRRAAAAIERAQGAAPNLPPPDEDNSLVKRLRAVQSRKPK